MKKFKYLIFGLGLFFFGIFIGSRIAGDLVAKRMIELDHAQDALEMLILADTYHTNHDLLIKSIESRIRMRYELLKDIEVPNDTTRVFFESAILSKNQYEELYGVKF